MNFLHQFVVSLQRLNPPKRFPRNTFAPTVITTTYDRPFFAPLAPHPLHSNHRRRSRRRRRHHHHGRTKITTTKEAKKYYPLFGLGANVALIFSGQYVRFVSAFRASLPADVDKWGVSLKLLMGE